jgi:putative ABC transport system substrate-binding protein
MIHRREFITLLGGAAAAWPLSVRAQQVPVIGHLSSTSFSSERRAAFHQGLKEAGFVHGQNLVVDCQAAHGQVERTQAMLATLLRRPVALIAANSVAARAARKMPAKYYGVFAEGYPWEQASLKERASNLIVRLASQDSVSTLVILLAL